MSTGKKHNFNQDMGVIGCGVDRNINLEVKLYLSYTNLV